MSWMDGCSRPSGLSFARAVVQGKGNSFVPPVKVARPGRAEPLLHERRSSSGSGGGSSPPKKEKSKKQKQKQKQSRGSTGSGGDKNSRRDSPHGSKSKSSGGKSNGNAAVGGGGGSPNDGPGWEGNAAALAEQRDQAVHSSQQKIKVVIAADTQ